MKRLPRRQAIHAAAFAVVMLLLPVGGWALAASISTAPLTAATITQSGQTQIVTHTRVVTKVVKGRVVRIKGGQRVILVSRVVIHNLRCHPTRRHHCVRRVVVPAHRIPLRAATIHQAVAIAAPLVPVTVVLTDVVTETLPAQTVTDVQTVTETGPTTTITVTAPNTLEGTP